MSVPTLYLRDVPEPLMTRLRRRARQNRRSMNAEAVAILQAALDGALEEGELMARLRSLQFTVPEGFPTGADLIRMDRDDPDHGRSRR